jgi:ankyrin repeat protein
MNQHANENALPPGYRSNLSNALYADDPQALLKHLAAYIHFQRSVFLTSKGGKIPSERSIAQYGVFDPWDCEEIKQSSVRDVDNKLYNKLKYDNSQPLANIHTLVFGVAVELACVRIVAMLLSNEYLHVVDPAHQNNNSIRVACMNEHIEVVKLLLNDTRVNPATCNNEVLRAASKYERVDMMKLLMSDTRVDPSDNRNETIRLASDRGHIKAVRLLLSNKRVDPSDKWNEAIRMASKNGHVEVVKLLMNHKRVEPFAKNNEAIRVACKNGHVEVAKLLLLRSNKRVDPSCKGNEAIRMASKNGHVEVVKLLMSHKRVEPFAKNNEAIRVASNADNLEVVKLLLSDKRVDPSHERNVVIRKALLEWANIDILRLLLADDRIVITNELLRIVDLSSSSKVDALFEAAYPRIWPKIIGNDLACVERQVGYLRMKLDRLELESSWRMLLCVKRRFTPTVAARVGDVLRDVCSEWINYRSEKYIEREESVDE